MREVVLNLYKDKKCSETISFEKGENSLSVLPYPSEIEGLQLVFKYHDGKKKMMQIYETGIARTIENIGLFESFWFEYQSSKHNYFVHVQLN
jgi:hypothetical protein